MVENVRLIQPTVFLEREYLDFYDEWKLGGEDMIPWVIKKDPTHFPEMVQSLLDAEKGEKLPEGWVPDSTYWLVSESNRILGVVNIRHSLTVQLSQNGGHIGYGIRPSERRKGYAGKMLSLSLGKAHSIGIDHALIVCDAWNEASKRTILRANGVKDEDFVEEDGNVILRYWVKTQGEAVIMNNSGRQFLDFLSIQELEMNNYQPIAGSFSVISRDEEVLLCYNVFREQWELPAGKRENQETPHECAIRELYEETGQMLNELHFQGLMKIKRASGSIQYNPVYSASIKELQPFIENPETNKIILWNVNDSIGEIDLIDEKLIKCLFKGTR